MAPYANFKLKYHIDYIASKISRAFGIIARLRHSVPLNTLIQIYRSLIFPYTYHGIAAWGQTAHVYLRKVFILQERALPLMFFAHGNLDSFMIHMNTVIEKILHENKYCAILGDFNLDLLQFETHSGTNDFLNILVSSYFQPQILQPTRITDHSATLIDNIFFNSLEHFTISGNLIYDLTDHLPNFLIVSKLSSLPENVKIFKRDYSNFDEQALINDIQSLDWNLLLSCNSDPSCMFDIFYSKISEFIDIHIPLKQLSKKESKLKTKPWITSAIRTSIKIKNKFYKKFLKTKSSYYQTKFKGLQK